jgi:hypothetical protein
VTTGAGRWPTVARRAADGGGAPSGSSATLKKFEVLSPAVGGMNFLNSSGALYIHRLTTTYVRI